jgi:hypothetical protein
VGFRVNPLEATVISTVSPNLDWPQMILNKKKSFIMGLVSKGL